MPDAMTLDSRIRAADGVLFQDLDGEGVLLNPKTGVYFGLNEVGCRVWQLLETHDALAGILAALLEEYDVAADTLASDLLALAAELESHELAVVT